MDKYIFGTLDLALRPRPVSLLSPTKSLTVSIRLSLRTFFFLLFLFFFIFLIKYLNVASFGRMAIPSHPRDLFYRLFTYAGAQIQSLKNVYNPLPFSVILQGGFWSSLFGHLDIPRFTGRYGNGVLMG